MIFLSFFAILVSLSSAKYNYTDYLLLKFQNICSRINGSFILINFNNLSNLDNNLYDGKESQTDIKFSENIDKIFLSRVEFELS